MTEQSSKNWHAKARALWRSGSSEADIAARFGVTRSAVEYALRIAKVAEKGMGQGATSGRSRANARAKGNGTVTDELDCVSMMQALERGDSGTYGYLKRYSSRDF